MSDYYTIENYIEFMENENNEGSKCTNDIIHRIYPIESCVLAEETILEEINNMISGITMYESMSEIGKYNINYTVTTGNNSESKTDTVWMDAWDNNSYEDI